MIKKAMQFLSDHFKYFALAAGILIFITILLGGMVRVSGASSACPDWPTCMGSWLPPAANAPVNNIGMTNDVTASLALINYLHRAATLLALPILLLSTLAANLRYLKQRWISLSMDLAAVLLLAQVGLGALVTLTPTGGTSQILPGLHLALSLTALGSVLVATTLAFYFEQDGEQGSVRLAYRSPFGRLALFVLGATFALLVSGAVVAASDARSACTAWPLCNPLQAGNSLAAWINLSHRGIVAFTAVLMAALVFKAWQTQRSQTAILVSTTAAGVLFFAQALLGAKLVGEFPTYLTGLHQATAISVWAAMVVLATAVGVAKRSVEDEAADRASIAGRKGLAKDLLMLTKPIVVALLLVTTFAGMVIGARAWPPINLVFWTLLGGFMAAGGSGAINQYIDRNDDRKMQRTQKRPIPSGRLTAGEGLAFGVAMALASFFVMVAFVNFLAALLSLAGIIYYVLIYSIFLKKTTVQNIVIGGGAGAIPPLVGWAAATGSLNVPSLFLFAVVFMWTPPHFWALALVRRKDYARAGVPMLPVVRGEQETRWQIFLYTLELVGLTLLLPLIGLGGGIYLVGAVLLGAWLLYAAWKVWKQGGNKVAWKMYRYSSMYLAFIFIVLMVDRLR